MKKIILLALFNSFLIYSFAKILKNNNMVDSVDIISYDINLEMQALSSKNIKGNTVITYLSKVNNMDYISLGLYKFTIDSVFVSGVKTLNYNYVDDKLQIFTDKKNTGDTGIVNIYYKGFANHEDWGGFYFTNDSSYAFNMGVGMTTDPHSIGRFWYPCIDEYSEKALYRYNVKVKEGYVAVCGGTLMDSINNQDGTINYLWEMSHPISSYLSSIAISKYYLIKDTFNGIEKVIPITIYCNVEDTFNVKESFRNLKNVLKIFENKFGPYRWERVGYVLVPFDYGAMEHATNIAFPVNLANGVSEDETMIMHELSHHWFGNLVTCYANKDMWLNEGFAVFSEGVFKEEMYGSVEMKRLLREYHKYCLHISSKIDNGVFPLDGMTLGNTYSKTVYNKGATVAQTLRYHLGEDNFFKYLKKYLNDYAYKNITIDGFREFLELESGEDLSDFFDNWIHHGGYPHFSIDNFETQQNGSKYEVKVNYKQRTKDRSFISRDNKIELLFIDKNWHTHYDSILINDEGGSFNYMLDFEPIAVMLDPNEKVYDATTDEIKIIKETGTVEYENIFALLEVNSTADSSMVRITHNWVRPDYFVNEIPGLHISNNRYWKVEGLFSNKLKAKVYFYYSKSRFDYASGLLDTALIKNSADSLVLLYRPDANYDWSIVNSTKSGNNTYGFLITDTIIAGEYALGIRDINRLSIDDYNLLADEIIMVYPNPAKDSFKIELKNFSQGIVKIYNINGNIEKTFNVNNKQIIDITDVKSGIYFVKLFDVNMQEITSKKIIVN
ncbi:MAG: hypothetical protein A2X12_07065 [Bacteroidetes bacterium GWE2_29_8]|nr:MAG: hypothetical protein A2X12_07065 [Bacteroidetes bacterium GWE2_29_8]OFY14229.1 MAG: hypothetical protein A2X02_04035 [Bacteroidetes bacterium GWF2_29_10]